MTTLAPHPSSPVSGTEKGHWLLGHAKELSHAPHSFPAEMAWRQGGLARFRILHKRLVAVAHPDYARHILVTNHERYERSFHYTSMQAIIGEGLITNDGDKWLKRRRQMLPAFRADLLKRVTNDTAAVTVSLMERWEAGGKSGEPVSAMREMQRLSLSVIGRTLLSSDVDDDRAMLFGKAVKDSLILLKERNTSPINPPLWVPVSKNRRLLDAKRHLEAYLQPHISSRQSDASPSQDLLSVLHNIKDPETGDGLTHQNLLDESKTLFVAGFETTATALTWTLYSLANHPDVAARWHEELDRELGGRPPAYEDLSRLTWTEQVINETLRLYPPVYNLGRICLQPDEINGEPIQPGDVILISVYGIHRSPNGWPEPLAFKPERFDPGIDWPRHAYMPFGIGKHICIGASFSLTEMKTALAVIGQRFHVERADTGSVEESPQITLAPSREIPLRFIPR